jgi:hypothetical protein
MYGAVRAPQARYFSLFAQREVPKRKRAPNYATPLTAHTRIAPEVARRYIPVLLATARILRAPFGFSSNSGVGGERFIRG